MAEKFIDAAFKDNSPLKTVEKIKSILRENNIETEEIWNETKVPYCYALKVKIKGLNFTTSGKGLSKEFALASAYGELVERIQLGFIGKRATQKDGSYSMNDSQDISLPVKQLLDGNMDWYKKMADRLFEWNGTSISAQDILLQYVDQEDNVDVTPFVNLMDGKTAYLPAKMRKAMYTSNGCAAGNTIEEAIVQAISEIVERYYRLRIIKENICVPQIPDKVLKQYPVAYDIISFIRDKGYKVWVKDCSLGDKFPVVCVCFIHVATGRYHTHFGAYPNFKIALTRALTETFQGRNVESFANFDDFFYNSTEKQFIHNISRELTKGTAKRMPDFFVGDMKYDYNEKVGFKGKDNKELLKECINFFAKQGYDILVRNSSGLGFPTCQVIIPGYSETYIHRLSKNTDENRYLSYAVKTLRNPSKATVAEMMGFLMHNKEIESYAIHPGKSGFLASAKIMASLTKEQEEFYLCASEAYVCFALGKYGAASKNVARMLSFENNKKEEFLICIKRYLDLASNGYSAEQIKRLLDLFHTEETVSLFYGYIDNKNNPFDEFVLHCDLSCDDSCILKDKCYQKKAQGLIDLINQKTKELCFEDFVRDINQLIS